MMIAINMAGHSAHGTKTMADETKYSTIRDDKRLFAKKPDKWNKNDPFQNFPFWCGYLPDRDTKDLLGKRNNFILRCLSVDDSLCVSVAIDDENNILNVHIMKDEKGHGYYFKGQNRKNHKPTVKDLVEFYWCTRIAIISKHTRVRLEVPVQKPYWLFSEWDLDFGSKIGDGAYGIVYKAQLIDVAKHISVAVKQLLADIPPDEIENLWDEARIMKALHHKNIVSFFGIINDRKPFSLVIELINGPSVMTYLEMDGQNSDNKTRLRMLIDAAKGMSYLHSQKPPFLHLDLAARNLLISWTRIGILNKRNNKDMIIKVADFGMSKQCKKYRIDTEKPLNIRWMDPYSFVNSKADCLTDVYAFGVTMYEVFCRPYRVPYPKWTPNQVYEEIIAAQPGQRKRLDRPEGMPFQAFEIMKSCMFLDERRVNRPTFSELVDVLENILKKL